MPQDGSNKARVLSAIDRRKFIRMGIIAGAAGTAGCSGDEGDGSGDGSDRTDGSDEENSVDTSSEEPVTTSYRSYSGRASPVDAQYNPYNATNSIFNENNSPGVMMYDWLLKYNPVKNEYERRLVDEFSIDGRTATMTLEDHANWSNGNDLTAEDVYTQYELERYQELPTWDNLEDVEVVGDYELEMTLENEANEAILLDQLNMRIEVNRDEYGHWLDELDSASNEEEVDNVLGELIQWSYPEEYPEEMPVSNGPFELVNATEDVWQLEYRDDYFLDINFDEVEYQFIESSEARWGEMISGNFDGCAHLASPSDVRERYPDHMTGISVPGFAGLVLHFQHDHPVVGNRKFRQALAYVADRQRIADQTLPRFEPRNAVAGLTPTQVNKWIDTDSLIDYGMESQPEEAAKAMEEGGFRKDGDTWVDSNGDPISLEMVTPPWPGPQNHANIWESVLGEFGINLDLRNLDGGTAGTAVTEGDFEIASWFFGNGPHPYIAWQGIGGTAWENQTVPLEPDLPPVGQRDGTTGSYNVVDTISAMPTTTDDDQMQQMVNEVAWWFNYSVPRLGLTQGTDNSFLNSQDFDFPSKDDDRIKNDHPNYDLLRQRDGDSDRARLQAKTE